MRPHPLLPLVQCSRSIPVLSGKRCSQVTRTSLLLCDSSSERIGQQRTRDKPGPIYVPKGPSCYDPDVVVGILEQQLRLLHDRAIRFPGPLPCPALSLMLGRLLKLYFTTHRRT